MKIHHVPLVPLWAFLSCAALVAGPLDPPAGPISSTGRFGPRTEINARNTPGDADSVYKITQPGSYYLAGNVAGFQFFHGIEIAVGGVTLDLQGFQVTGVANALDGIFVSGAEGFATGITIRNGSIGNWPGDGIDASNALDIRIDDITVNFGVGAGIVVADNAVVTNCAVRLTQRGIQAGSYCRFAACRAEQILAGEGFEVQAHCRFLDCAAMQCSSHGFEGLDGLSLTRCDSIGNGANGFNVQKAAELSACTAASNGTIGFFASSSSVLDRCIAFGNQSIGFFIGGGVLAACTAEMNGLTGIVATSSCVVQGCVSRSNGGHGIESTLNTTIESCIACQNAESGIDVFGNCVIRGNHCYENGQASAVGAGIRATGNDSHIEGNYLEGNDFGLDIDGDRNVIIRNHARGNTQNYAQVSSGNLLGSIVSTQSDQNTAVNSHVNWSF